MRNPIRYFNSSPAVIRLAVMMYIRYPLSLRQVEDLLFERGIDICQETVRLWWNRFGPMFAAVHASIRNHFNQDRHLNSREIFKQNRSAALAEWRQLAARGERGGDLIAQSRPIGHRIGSLQGDFLVAFGRRLAVDRDPRTVGPAFAHFAEHGDHATAQIGL